MWEEKVLRVTAIFSGILFAVSLAMLLIPGIRWPAPAADTLFFLMLAVLFGGLALTAGSGAYELSKKKTKKESSLGK